MPETNFVTGLYEQLKEAETILDSVLEEELKEESRDIETTGYLIRKYKITSFTTSDVLIKIYASMRKVLENELSLREQVKKKMTELKAIERDYNAKGFQKKYGKLKVDNLLNYLDTAFFSSRIVINNVSVLIDIFKDPEKIKTFKGEKLARIFKTTEKNTSNVINFIKTLKRISNLLSNFSSTEYYPNPKSYGRAMNVSEFRKTVKNSSLSSSKDPTPVFDMTPKIMDSLLRKTPDQRKDFFRTIGAKGADKVIFFETKLKPVNADKPIPQSNGLLEYKFPKGIHIDILKAA